MQPFHIGDVVVVRVPVGTSNTDKAAAIAVAKQMAYDYSDHPEEWRNNYYNQRRLL